MESYMGANDIDWQSLPCLPLKSRGKLRAVPGVFLVIETLASGERELVFVGKTVNIRERCMGTAFSLFRNPSTISIAWIEAESQAERRRLQEMLEQHIS